MGQARRELLGTKTRDKFSRRVASSVSRAESVMADAGPGVIDGLDETAMSEALRICDRVTDTVDAKLEEKVQHV